MNTKNILPVVIVILILAGVYVVDQRSGRQGNNNTNEITGSLTDNSGEVILNDSSDDATDNTDVAINDSGSTNPGGVSATPPEKIPDIYRLPLKEGQCYSASNCSDMEYCQFVDGQCGGVGDCQVKQEICTKEYMPVCGCDGQTYGNHCEATAAGASIRRAGECQ